MQKGSLYRLCVGVLFLALYAASAWLGSLNAGPVVNPDMLVPCMDGKPPVDWICSLNVFPGLKAEDFHYWRATFRPGN